MCERWWFTDLCYRFLQPPKPPPRSPWKPLPYSCRLYEDLGSITNLTLKPSKVTQYTEAVTRQSVLFILLKNTEHFPKCHRRVAQDLGPVHVETQSHANKVPHQRAALCRTPNQWCIIQQSSKYLFSVAFMGRNITVELTGFIECSIYCIHWISWFYMGLIVKISLQLLHINISRIT